MIAGAESKAVRTGKIQNVNYENKKGTATISHTVIPKNAPKPEVKVTRMPSSSKDKK
jgi:hypothetical protein